LNGARARTRLFNSLEADRHHKEESSTSNKKKEESEEIDRQKKWRKKSDLRNGAFRHHLGNGSDDEYCIYMFINRLDTAAVCCSHNRDNDGFSRVHMA